MLLLSSGSSAFRELGPHGEGHLVAQARWPCAPCAHDPGCLASATTFPCTEALEPGPLADLAAAAVRGDLPTAPLAGTGALYRAVRDDLGLVRYLPVGSGDGDDACADLLRDHLLAGLPVAQARATGAAPAQGPTPTSALGRRSLSELRQVVQALRPQAGGAPGHHLDLRQVTSPIVLAFAATVGRRLREASTPQGTSELARELQRLEQRVSTALASM